MRKTTRTVATAFINGKSCKVNNTESTGSVLYLHDNAIARHCNGRVQVSLAGWNTVTTRERVNGVLTLIQSDYGVSQKDGAPRLTKWRNGWTIVKDMNPNAWYDAMTGEKVQV